MAELRDDQPRWRQVRDIIAARIASGLYKPGQRVPGERDLQQEFGIAGTTAHKVLVKLREDGLIYTERGMGSFVAPPPDAEAVGQSE
ncbi:GntR family transcriptional regulator [Nonomuraea glycinis]|uniref:GntR family transcriptional regulator n=1 Tax=Nonomuraea glycinis TaxID=2047744 RepID=UPI002E13EC52|nr:GntR family transcriptional regulator [Nonomuraea glycinis]